jgi:uncharacterized protein YciI
MTNNRQERVIIVKSLTIFYIFDKTSFMREIIYGFSMMAIIVSSTCCVRGKVDISRSDEISGDVLYDSALAQKYGADKYGMKTYVIAFLKKGPNKKIDSLERQEVFSAHMQNIDRMAENGDLVLAGPFMGEEDLKGIYVFNVSTLEEAEKLTNTDPAIQTGYLEMELKLWYGSAGLMGLNDLHKRVSSSLISEG